MAELLLDTDVFIDHLRGHRRLRASRDRASYSVVTRCELFAGSRDGDDRVRSVLAPFRELSVDRRIAELAGSLRRESAIRTPDALIAATALAYRLTLMTRNQRDFEPVRGLRFRAPGD